MISFLPSTILKVRTEAAKNSEQHLLKTNTSHSIAISSKPSKGLEQVPSLQNRAKNESNIFVISYTNCLTKFSLILPNTLKKSL